MSLAARESGELIPAKQSGGSSRKEFYKVFIVAMCLCFLPHFESTNRQSSLGGVERGNGRSSSMRRYARPRDLHDSKCQDCLTHLLVYCVGRQREENWLRLVKHW